MTPKFRLRAYQGEEDYWRLREFLRRVFLFNQRRELTSWHVATLDYARAHVYANCNHLRLEDTALLWETEQGDIAAALTVMDPGDAHFQVHPQFRSMELEEELLLTAEECLSARQQDGSRKLSVFTVSTDEQRKELFSRHGYHLGEWPEVVHYRDLTAPIRDVPLAAGFSVRSLGDGLELLERTYASGLGFHEGNIQIAVDNRKDVSWYRSIQNAPLYRRDLDLVAVSPDGEVASFCTIWFDDETRSAIFEPVATVPTFQRRGLGKAVMTEGLRRLKRMGALVASVGGFSSEANALYDSAVSTDREVHEHWEKVFS